MVFPKSIRKALRHAPVGDRCIHCDGVCDSSAILGMQINPSEIMSGAGGCSVVSRIVDRRKKKRRSS